MLWRVSPLTTQWLPATLVRLSGSDATTAAVAVALPDLGASDEGFQVTVKKSDSSSNDVTVEADGSDTINDEATYVLVEQYEGITLIWTGAEWITGGGGSAVTLTGVGIADLLEAIPVEADKLSFNALKDTPESVGGFDLYADVVTHQSAIATHDRFVFADISEAGEPNRYATLTNIKTAVAFDLHTDVPTAHSTPHTDDRMVITAEEETNDPMRYISLTQLHIFMRDALDIHDTGWSQLTSPDSLDRLAVSDENLSGDPMRYMTLGQIKTFSAFDFHDDVSTNLVSIATADRMLISDEGTSGDPMRYVTLAQLDSRFTTTVTAFDIKDDVTQSATIANTDRLIFSDESAAGDPNRYTTFQNFRTALNIPASATGFDLHDDVTSSATIADADRIVFSDEQTTGDPNRYTTFSNFRTALSIPGSLGSDITTIDTLSQAAYDALTPNANTLYLITS